MTINIVVKLENTRGGYMKILGFEIQKGEYQGVSYENVYFTLEKSIVKKKEEGLAAGTVATLQKVKGSVVRDFEVSIRIAGHGGLIGKDVSFLFDGFGNVALIKLVE